jgi:hypothetical protein
MIQSCRYCLKFIHTCPRCCGPVLTRTIVEQVPQLGYISTSLFLCLTMECQNYGNFKLNTESSVETIVCKECTDRRESIRKAQENLRRRRSCV